MKDFLNKFYTSKCCVKVLVIFHGTTLLCVLIQIYDFESAGAVSPTTPLPQAATRGRPQTAIGSKWILFS